MESKGIDTFHKDDRAIMKIDGFRFGGSVRKVDKVKNLVHIRFDYDGYVSRVSPELLSRVNTASEKKPWHGGDINILKANLHLSNLNLALLLDRTVSSIITFKSKNGLHKPKKK